jgi:hypothetical protein
MSYFYTYLQPTPNRLPISNTPVFCPASISVRSALSPSRSPSGFLSDRPTIVARRLPADTDILRPRINDPVLPCPTVRGTPTPSGRHQSPSHSLRMKRATATVTASPERERSNSFVPTARSNIDKFRLSVDCSIDKFRNIGSLPATGGAPQRVATSINRG